MSTMETRSLLCPLSDEDFKLRAHNLAVARQKAREIESEKKTVTARFGQQLKEVNEQIDQLAQVVKTKTEHRPVMVEWIADHKTSTMRLVRLDTDTEIDSKPMTMAEKQEKLKFNTKPAPAGDAKPDAKAKKNGKAKAATTETPASV